jgi:NADPH2:quinone reductase
MASNQIKHMKAVIITQPGDAAVLQVGERPIPEVGERDVLVRVHAAGVNRPDVFQRKGNYPAPPGVSADIAGLEVAGMIEAVGSKVRRWKAGDKVCALLAGGGYAEFCTVDEGQCLPIPSGLSMVEGASLPETFFTVWSNVFDRVRLQPGETFLVHGGTSGIGVAAIQMAKAWGATVFATAGTDEKCEACMKLGATQAVNYNKEDFKSVLSELTAKGVDVILDMVGGNYTQKNLELLATEGRLVLINYMKGDEATIRLSQILRKRLTLTGSTLRARDAVFKSAIARKLEQFVWPWLESGSVKPVVYKTFPLAQASDAHRLLEEGHHIGKLVLVCH